MLPAHLPRYSSGVAAVERGLISAIEQHAAADIPRLLFYSRGEPQAVVCVMAGQQLRNQVAQLSVTLRDLRHQQRIRPRIPRSRALIPHQSVGRR